MVNNSIEQESEREEFSEDHYSSSDSEQGSSKNVTQREASQGTSLAPTVRFVTQKTVDKHWKPLSTKSRQHIHDLILNSVPVVLNSARGVKRKTNLQDLLDKLIAKIDKSLETLQVPKTSKNVKFDYSKLHSQNRSLELTLAQELDQTSQMEMQLEHEKLLLKEDTRSLTKFRSDKKAVNSRNKMLQRNKLHPLLKEEFENAAEIDDELIKSHFKPLKDNASSLYHPKKDDQLCEIEKSLSLHLRSIEKNAQTIDDLVSGIDEARNSLLQLMKNAGFDDKLAEKICL